MLFSNLKKIREFERRSLSFMCSLEDREILIAIGYAMEMGAPLSLKELTLGLSDLNLLGLGSVTTIRRRLMRLINRGMVVKRMANHDGRVIHLVLTGKARNLFASYGRMMASMRWQGLRHPVRSP